MPRRIISESVCSSPTLASLSAEAERLFFRLLTVTDDFGRFRASPGEVRASCFQASIDSVKTPAVAGWLDELERAELIVRYTVGDRVFGAFVSFLDHNTPRAKVAKYPDPDGGMEPGWRPVRASANICAHVHADANTCAQMHADENICAHVQTNAPLSGAVSGAVSGVLDEAGSCQRSPARKLARDEGSPTAAKWDDTSTPMLLAEHWRAELVRAYPTHRLGRADYWHTQRQRWAADVDKLMRLDGRTEPDVRALVGYVMGGWWAANCQSPSKLREKWDVISAQRDREAAGGKGAPKPKRKCVKCPSTEDVQDRWDMDLCMACAVEEGRHRNGGLFDAILAGEGGVRE